VADYVNFTQDVLMKLGLDIKKCQGQGYDGGSVMSRTHSGEQTSIKHCSLSAKYVHC